MNTALWHSRNLASFAIPSSKFSEMNAHPRQEIGHKCTAEAELCCSHKMQTFDKATIVLKLHPRGNDFEGTERGSIEGARGRQ